MPIAIETTEIVPFLGAIGFLMGVVGAAASVTQTPSSTTALLAVGEESSSRPDSA